MPPWASRGFKCQGSKTAMQPNFARYRLILVHSLHGQVELTLRQVISQFFGHLADLLAVESATAILVDVRKQVRQAVRVIALQDRLDDQDRPACMATRLIQQASRMPSAGQVHSMYDA